jgi:hypothetical protein
MKRQQAERALSAGSASPIGQLPDTRTALKPHRHDPYGG